MSTESQTVSEATSEETKSLHEKVQDTLEPEGEETWMSILLPYLIIAGAILLVVLLGLKVLALAIGIGAYMMGAR